MKVGDLVRYSPDATEVRVYGIDDAKVGLVISLRDATSNVLPWAKVQWSGHIHPDAVLVEDLEIISEAKK